MAAAAVEMPATWLHLKAEAETALKEANYSAAISVYSAALKRLQEEACDTALAYEQSKLLSNRLVVGMRQVLAHDSCTSLEEPGLASLYSLTASLHCHCFSS